MNIVDNGTIQLPIGYILLKEYIEGQCVCFFCTIVYKITHKSKKYIKIFDVCCHDLCFRQKGMAAC